MAHRRENDRIRLNSKSLGRGLIDSGNGGGEIKDLDHAAALGAGIPAIAPADVIGSNAPLLVGRTGQSDQRILPGYKMFDLDCVAHCIDVGNGGLHPVIDQDAALDSQFQSRLFGQMRIGGHTDGQHHHVGMQGSGIRQQYIHSPVLFLKALY